MDLSLNKTEIIKYLRTHCKDNFISLSYEQEASILFNITIREVEFIALSEGIMPMRYSRNKNSFSINEQLILHNSHVTVIGCGGLGGHVIEQLVRLGIGTIRVVDNDVFEEHNLNRQILSSIEHIGKLKVVVAKERAYKLNPAVIIEDMPIKFDKDSASMILADTQVVVDALDNINNRVLLVEHCKEFGIPIIHGSIGGYYGLVTTQFPDSDLLQRLFEGRHEKGVELELGNPAFTPTLVSAIQVVETVNIILNKPCRLKNILLSIDLSDLKFKTLLG